MRAVFLILLLGIMRKKSKKLFLASQKSSRPLNFGPSRLFKFATIVCFCSIFLMLTGCFPDGGSNFQHLQDQDPATFRSLRDNTSSEQNISAFEHLNDNLCTLDRYCCDEFTDDEIFYKEIETRAIIERNIELCYDLPLDELFVDCPGEEPYIYYSQQRCLIEADENN